MQHVVSMEVMERRRKLITALRDGSYKQTVRTLREDDCYCVQGVAIDLLGTGNWVPRQHVRGGDGVQYISRDKSYDGSVENIVYHMSAYQMELYEPGERYLTPLDHAMILNDVYMCDFKVIADYLEDQWFPQDGA